MFQSSTSFHKTNNHLSQSRASYNLHRAFTMAHRPSSLILPLAEWRVGAWYVGIGPVAPMPMGGVRTIRRRTIRRKI